MYPNDVGEDLTSPLFTLSEISQQLLDSYSWHSVKLLMLPRGLYPIDFDKTMTCSFLTFIVLFYCILIRSGYYCLSLPVLHLVPVVFHRDVSSWLDTHGFERISMKCTIDSHILIRITFINFLLLTHQKFNKEMLDQMHVKLMKLPLPLVVLSMSC